VRVSVKERSKVDVIVVKIPDWVVVTVINDTVTWDEDEELD
jgi:hypothetical protein